MTSIFSAVRLAFILIAIPAASVQASSAIQGSELMTGVELTDQINSTLEKHDINGTPLVNPKQKFIACDENLYIHPLHDSWKTLKLTCPSNEQWRLLVRVKIDTSGFSATPLAAEHRTTRQRQRKRQIIIFMPLPGPKHG